MPKILLAEDDKETLRLTAEWLEHHQYSVDTAPDGGICRELLTSGKYDLIILDWRMPEITGLEICKWFRSRGGDTPILFLTGKDEIESIEDGFAAGADDYLTKPFSMRELTARVSALMRRGNVAPTRTITIGPLVINPTNHEALLDGKGLKLTAKEFAVLECLARHPGQTFSTTSLLERVWKRTADVSPDTVRVYIRRLRELFTAAGYPEMIQNIHGVGYKFNSSAVKD